MTPLLSQILLFCVLLLFLIVGFLYKRGAGTIKEYALGKGPVSTPILMATMVATTIGGGSLVGQAAAFYQNGPWLFIASCTMPIGYCVMALVIVPKLSKYYGCLSIAEIMGQMYGERARKIVGLAAFLFCLGMLGAQIKTFYWVMQSMFVDNALIATVIGLSIVILYSSMGGVSSVIRTDILQFFIFIIIIPIVASYIIQISGGITQITSSVPDNAGAFFHKGSLTAFMALSVFYLLPDIAPDCFHRFLIGRDCKKNQATTYALAFVNLVNLIFVGCLAYIALSRFSGIKPQDTLFVVIKGLVASEWAIVLFKIALVAIIVSTADSLINTGAVILTHDVFAKKITEEQKIKLLKGAAIFSGIIALFIACFFPGVLETILFVWEYYFVIVLVPFIGGLFIKEIRQEPFWVSFFVGFSAFTILHFVYPDLGHEIFLISSFASTFGYVVTFFIVRRGEANLPFFSLSKLCDAIVEKHSIQGASLSWIILLFFLLSVLLKDAPLTWNGSSTFIEFIAGFLGFLLFFVDKLSLKHRGVVVLFSIWFCFSFFPTYVFLCQKTANVFTINFVAATVLLAGLFSWNIFITFLLSGGFFAVVIFLSFGHRVETSLSSLMYLCSLMGYVALIAYIAFRKKELGILEFIRSKLKAEKDIEQAIKDSDIQNKILRAIKASLDADAKYKNILLNEDKTIRVVFKDLKDNILAYFQQISVERKTKLTIIGAHSGALNTGLPLGFFYKIVYSLILNVFYCSGGGRIQVRFCCDNSNKMEGIDVAHGKYKINDRMRYFRGTYPEGVLKWGEIKMLLEKLEIKIVEGNKRLKIIFPSEPVPDKDNVIYFKELLQTQSANASSGKASPFSYEKL